MIRMNVVPWFTNPLAVWTALALRAGEMMWASGQVIGHRTSRALLADPRHRERDRREFTLMGREKLEAGSEAFAAMAAHLSTLNMQYAMVAFSQWMAMSKAMLALANSRSIAQSVEQQARLARMTMVGAAKSAATVANSAGRVAHHGLKPIHARATKNARRLGKK